MSLIGGNCKNSPMNIMLIPPNTFKMQPAIDIL